MSHPKYDVFLSFRGEDTRDNFTSHLHAELCRQNIETFIDNRLVRGEEISSELCKAIEESAIYVIILSQHYASSRWCLDELTQIVECKERYGRVVIPVFYNVDPSDVRHQRKSYADDFVRHEQRFGDKVDAWKAALTQVANLSGFDSQKIRPNSKLVEEIVKDIQKKLSNCVSNNHEEKIGIGKHIKEIQTLLHLESSIVRIIGIWGMGGIGKTEIAGAIYEKLATHFSFAGIIKNVHQEIKLHRVEHVKSKYLSHLLVHQDTTSSKSNISFDPRLKRTKVLLVFDDVKDYDQLNDLIGTCSNFGPGSRIIVTSRDKQVLKNANVDEIYHVVEMNDKDSLQLFCLNAFKQKEPIETYVSLSKKVLHYAKGVPLALKVLGLFLQDRAKEAWESQLQKLEKSPEPKIFDVLKLSYDGLDDEQKDIFLDIACFYKGITEKCVVQTLDCYGFSTRIGMDVLQDKCLISISEDRVWMHDRIQEMGHEIVRQESVNNPEKRSRLHKPDDIYDVLKKNQGQGTNAIQSMVLNRKEIKKVQLHATTFKEMHNLRMIIFYELSEYSNVTFHTILNSFPNNLIFLGWNYFPQKSLPQDFCPDNLITLDMPYSNLEQLWKNDKIFPNLKRLDLSSSKKMIGVPDLCLFPNIEEIILIDCVSLEKVYSSNFLHKLNCLRLDGCTSLKSLSIRSNILSRSTGFLTLQKCHNLETISITTTTDVVETLIMSRFEGGYGYPNPYGFWLDEYLCDILEQYPCEFLSEQYPCEFLLDQCPYDCDLSEALTRLPTGLLNSKFKTMFRLDNCLKLEELPSSLHHLIGLEELSFHDCIKLKTIPSSIGNLTKLLNLDLTYCESLETFPSSIFKLKLTKLDFYGCSMLSTFPEIPCDIGRLSCFTQISLQGTNIVNLPDSMVHLSSLKSLDLSDCTRLECIPKLPRCLGKLLAFDCPSIKKVVPNPLLKLMSDSNYEMDGLYEFHLTKSKELEASSLSYIVNEALIKITDNAHLSAVFSFPGSRVPDWFTHRCHGHSITVNNDFEYLCSENRLIGFALCIVFRDEDMDDPRITVSGTAYRLSFISDGKPYIFYDKLYCEYKGRYFIQDHTFIWKHQFDSARISNSFLDAYKINFEILGHSRGSHYQLNVKVKECGICPLYTTKESKRAKLHNNSV